MSLELYFYCMLPEQVPASPQPYIGQAVRRMDEWILQDQIGIESFQYIEKDYR